MISEARLESLEHRNSLKKKMAENFKTVRPEENKCAKCVSPQSQYREDTVNFFCQSEINNFHEILHAYMCKHMNDSILIQKILLFTVVSINENALCSQKIKILLYGVKPFYL